MAVDEREEADFSKKIALQSVAAIGVVVLASLLHAVLGLAVCNDDSGGLSRCWMYDSPGRGGWADAAIYVLLAPVALVVVASGVALWYWRPWVLWSSTAVALAFTVVLGIAGYAIFGSPN